MLQARYLFLISILIAGHLTCKAQTIDPFDGHAADYRVKLERYFSTPAAEQAGLKCVSDSVNSFVRERPWTRKTVNARLDAYEKILVSLNRHHAYFQLLAYKNKLDTAARSSKQHINQLIETLDTRTHQQLRRPLFASLAQKPGFAYQYLIQQVMV
jgi:hypothetical protein